MAKKKKKGSLFMGKKTKNLFDDMLVNPLHNFAKSKKFKRGY